jgi:hypothetical protein
MKRVLLLAVLGVSFSVLAAPAVADNSGTGCIAAGGADIIGASVSYDTDLQPTPDTVTGGPRTATASCKDVTFTMFVVGYDTSGNSTGILGTARSKGSEFSFVGQLNVLPITAPYVCVYFTSTKGSNVYDIAPDSMCPLSFDASDPLARPTGVFAPGEGAPGGGGFYT